MALLKYDVPLVAQEKDNCCWHTSAYMIWLYWQQHGKGAGPMNTIASSYAVSDTQGIGPGEFITLAKKVGLKALPVKNLHAELDLVNYLRNHGPIWCAGYWFGFGHIIVLTGIEKGNVLFNDPDGGVKKQGTVSWFNEKLAGQFQGCLMYKDMAAY